MRHGQLVEQGPVRQILREPSHQYTRRLLNAVPGMGRR
jgi:ABC-type dipeptide/oligopeptide/nickel transport system ATPase component